MAFSCAPAGALCQVVASCVDIVALPAGLRMVLYSRGVLVAHWTSCSCMGPYIGISPLPSCSNLAWRIPILGTPRSGTEDAHLLPVARPEDVCDSVCRGPYAVSFPLVRLHGYLQHAIPNETRTLALHVGRVISCPLHDCGVASRVLSWSLG